jgi:ribosome maturation factor RimP
MALLDLAVSRGRGTTRVLVTVHKGGAGGNVGVEDCSRLHRALLPRLELAFPGEGLYVEVSSPGINRPIKDGAEFARHTGRGVSCYRTDLSAWVGGVLRQADEKGVILETREGTVTVELEKIAKAKLDYSLEV